MLLEFSLDIHLVWAEGNAAGLQGSTSGMRERVRVPTNYAPMFLNMRCGPTILRTWADNYLEASPGKAGHLAYIQVVVVCTLESRIPSHQVRQLTLAPLTLPQEHKTETRNRISRDPERMLAGHNLTGLALFILRSSGAVQSFDELEPSYRSLPQSGPAYDSDHGCTVSQLLHKDAELRPQRPGTLAAAQRSDAEAAVQQYVAAEALEAFSGDGAIERAAIWCHSQASRGGQDVVGSLQRGASRRRKNCYVLVEYGNDPRPWVATVQHFLRVRLAPEDDPDGMQPTLRLAVLTLFERRTAPGPSGLHVASARRLVRDGAAHPVAVDSLQGMLVSAEPPAGEEDAGSIFFMEYFAFSKL